MASFWFNFEVSDGIIIGTRYWCYFLINVGFYFTKNQPLTHVWHGAAVGELVYDPTERAARAAQCYCKDF